MKSAFFDEVNGDEFTRAVAEATGRSLNIAALHEEAKAIDQILCIHKRRAKVMPWIILLVGLIIAVVCIIVLRSYVFGWRWLIAATVFAVFCCIAVNRFDASENSPSDRFLYKVKHRYPGGAVIRDFEGEKSSHESICQEIRHYREPVPVSGVFTTMKGALRQLTDPLETLSLVQKVLYEIIPKEVIKALPNMSHWDYWLTIGKISLENEVAVGGSAMLSVCGGEYNVCTGSMIFPFLKLAQKSIVPACFIQCIREGILVSGSPEDIITVRSYFASEVKSGNKELTKDVSIAIKSNDSLLRWQTAERLISSAEYAIYAGTKELSRYIRRCCDVALKLDPGGPAHIRSIYLSQILRKSRVI